LVFLHARFSFLPVFLPIQSQSFDGRIGRCHDVDDSQPPKPPVGAGVSSMGSSGGKGPSSTGGTSMGGRS